MIIENYYFDKLTLNLDVSAISNLPSNLVSTFSKLMQHVSTNDSRIKNLVLDIMKVITEFSEDDDSIALTIILRINLLVSILSLLKVLVVLMVKCHSKSLLQKLIRALEGFGRPSTPFGARRTPIHCCISYTDKNAYFLYGSGVNDCCYC